MKADAGFVAFAIAAMQAAFMPRGSYFITAPAVRDQLADALKVVEWGECIGWTPAQRQLLAAARDWVSRAALLCDPLDPDVVRVALRDPWPVKIDVPAWMARPDVGNGPEAAA